MSYKGDFEIIMYLWEIFVCFYETFLITYLFTKKIGFYKKPFFLCLFILIIWTILSLLTFIGWGSGTRLLIMLMCYIVTSFLFFGKHPIENKFTYILWSCFYIFLSTASERLTISLAYWLTDYPLQELLVFGSARIQFTLIHLLVFSVFIWLTTHLNEKNPFLPLPLVLIVVVLVGIGIFATETILSISLVLDTKPEMHVFSKQLSLTCYIILIMLFAFFACFEYLGILRRKTREMEQEKQLNDLEQQQYELMVSATESLRKWKHDYQGQLKLITTLIAQNNYQEVSEYARQLNSALPFSESLLATGNCAVDAVVSLRMLEARRDNIAFHSTVFLPDQLPLNNVELSSLIGNILDNAIEACRKAPHKAEIRFEIKPFKQMLSLFCCNTSDGKYWLGAEDILLSTKKEEGHGIGTRRIRQIVENAGGICQLTPKPEQFTVQIMIPLCWEGK